MKRFRFQDRPTRIADSHNQYQQESAIEVNRGLRNAAELFRQSAESSTGEGERAIRETQQAMTEFKKASARRWGREKPAETAEDRARANDEARVRDKRLSPMQRFMAASRLFRRDH